MEEITEVADYVNVPEGPADKKATGPEHTKKGSAPEGTVDTKASPPGLRFFLPIAVCWLILLAIMGLRIYFTSELSEDNAKQSAEILNLTSRIQELETRENLTVSCDNLIQAYTVLESNVKDLNAEILNLTSRIQELETRENLTVSCDNLTQAYTVSESNVKDLNAEIKTLTSQKDGLTTQIKEMETNWNELNVSRAQWSINQYCKQSEVTQCQPCEMNWRYREPSCYSFDDVGPTERLTWEEAREYCRALNADLAAAHNEKEKNIINYYSISTDGSWIGLRVENGKWKWADGSDLTNSSWVDPPTEGHCALSVLRINTWSSVSCEEKQQWICQKKALSV